jgi:hypothetical protein
MHKTGHFTCNSLVIRCEIFHKQTEVEPPVCEFDNGDNGASSYLRTHRTKTRTQEGTSPPYKHASSAASRKTSAKPARASTSEDCPSIFVGRGSSLLSSGPYDTPSPEIGGLPPALAPKKNRLKDFLKPVCN